MKLRKHWLITLMLVCLMMVSACHGSSNKDEQELTKDSYRSIKVVELEGEVKVERKKIGEVAAYKDMHLVSGDRVHVRQGSYARLSLDDDKYVYAEENTIFSIIAKGNAKDSETYLKLEQGAITTEIQDALSQKSKFEVITPNSTMAVRGTVYRVQVEQQELKSQTKLEVFDGVVASTLCQPDGRKNGKLSVPAGKAVRVAGDEDLSHYVFEDAKEKLFDVKLEDLSSQALEILKTIVLTDKHPNIVVNLQEIEDVIDKRQKRYAIHFDSHGAGNIPSLYLAEGSSYELPKPLRAGYIFAGWYEDAGYRSEHTKKVMEDKDLTLHAHWLASKHTPYQVISYVETSTPNVYMEEKVEQRQGTTNASIRLGEKKEGFHINYAKSNITGRIAANGSSRFVIYYDRDELSLTLENQGSIYSYRYPYGTEVALPTFYKEGYEFLGYQKAQGDTLYKKDYVLYEDTRLQTCWKPRDDVSYQVHVYEEILERDEYSLVKKETRSATCETLLDEQFFKKEVPSGFTLKLEPQVVAGDGSTLIKLYLQRNRYQVNYHFLDGSIQSKQYKHGEGIVLPQGEGQRGWYLKPQGEGEEMQAHKAVMSNMDLYEVEKQVYGNYQIIYHYQNAKDDRYDEEISPVVEEKKDLIGTQIKLEPPQKEGFEIADTSLLNGVVKADGSLRLHVYYQRLNYHIVLLTHLGEVIYDELVNYHAMVYLPTLEIAGYEFHYWQNVDDPKECYVETMPANKDITLQAVLTLKDANVFTYMKQIHEQVFYK